MSATSNVLLTPKTNAAKQYLRDRASEAVTNTALAYVSVILSVGLIGMCGYTVWLSKRIVAEKPLVIRTDAVGRPEGVDLQWNDYKPDDREMKYFLTQFVAGFYARSRYTVQDVYPTSLHFLSGQLVSAVSTADRDTKWMAKFLNSSDPDVNIDVTNVALDRTFEPRFKAEVVARKVITGPGGSDQKVIPFVVTVWFHVDPALLNGAREKDPELFHALWKINPLGYVIDSFRADEGWEAQNRNSN